MVVVHEEWYGGADLVAKFDHGLFRFVNLALIYMLVHENRVYRAPINPSQLFDDDLVNKDPEGSVGVPKTCNRNVWIKMPIVCKYI